MNLSEATTTESIEELARREGLKDGIIRIIHTEVDIEQNIE